MKQLIIVLTFGLLLSSCLEYVECPNSGGGTSQVLRGSIFDCT